MEPPIEKKRNRNTLIRNWKDGINERYEITDCGCYASGIRAMRTPSKSASAAQAMTMSSRMKKKRKVDTSPISDMACIENLKNVKSIYQSRAHAIFYFYNN